MLKGNKGEWSEPYTLLKLLADGKLHAADSDLNKLSLYYPLIKVLRQENEHSPREYLCNKNIKIIDGTTQSEIKSVSVEEFLEATKLLLQKIDEGTGSFAIPEIESFLNSIDINTLKAKSEDKSDINIVVHDMITGFNPKLGFSIKSRLGNPSTLFNANKDTTNFIFKIQGSITDDDIANINSIDTRSKIKDRIQEVYNKGFSIIYHDVTNENFKMNLQLIDSSLPLIMGHIILGYYSGEGTSLVQLVGLVSRDNPCGFNLTNDHKFYDYKIKNFLTDVALGMTPATVWSGRYDATGGYIIVKEDGEIVCYHLYNRNEFQDYLLKNTKLDAPSSSRHQYGVLYKENGDTFIKLNLQIRFKH